MQNKLSLELSYLPSNCESLIQEKCQLKINMAVILNNKDPRTILFDLLSYIEKKFKDFSVVISHQPLYTDLQLASYSGLDENRIDCLVQLVVDFVLYFRLKDFQKIDYKSADGLVDIDFETPTFVGGYGIVELRVLENYLFTNESIVYALSEIVDFTEEKMYSESALRPHWLSTNDIQFNIKKLMTNAGFYFGSSPLDDLNLWCSEYFDSLILSDCLFPAPGCYPNFFKIEARIYNKYKQVKQYGRFPSPAEYYQKIKGKKVLFMTPFSEEVNLLFSSRKIFNLYTDIEIPTFNICAIPAFISTYPNRPHKSWSETFDVMKQLVDEMFRSDTFDIFTASCGLYGMPICNYVYKKYGCVVVYYGNHMNTLFGIRQQCSDSFMKDRRVNENWIDSNLSRFKNLNLIDDGRYI